jgi:hypothetical protein
MSNLILRGMNVKKYALAVVMVVLLAAGYSQRSEAQAFDPCPATGTYAQLIALGACTIDDKLFGNFEQLGTPDVPVTYTVVSTATEDGFIFQFGLTANNNDAKDFSLLYDVQCIGGDPCIISADLTLQGFAVLPPGTGTVSIGETVCEGGFHTGTCTGTAGFLAVGSDGTIAGTTLTAHLEFPGVNTLGITKDINATCGGTCTLASLSLFQNTVDQAPEPATLLLFGAGLAGLAFFRRRKAA